MFYLGSIAGFLPYILAFALTIVWSGHAGKPFFSRDSIPETSIGIVKESVSKVEILLQIDSDNQAVEETFPEFAYSVCTPTKLFSFCFLRLLGSEEFGISLLRAPPVSLF